MLWANLISAGTAEGRSSGSILILLALHRPTMQPSHLPTLPIQRHMASRSHSICSFAHDKLNTPALPGRVGEVSASVAGETLAGPLLFPVRVKDCMMMCSLKTKKQSLTWVIPGHPSSPATHYSHEQYETARARLSESKKRQCAMYAD